MLIGAIALVSALAGVGVCLLSGGFANGSWVWTLPLVFAGSFLLLLLLGFLFLLYLCKRVDQDVPQEKDDRFYRFVTDIIIESALPVLRIHVKKKGMEKVPSDGRFLLVCNHTSNSDPILLLRCFRKNQLAFISKRENKTMFVIGPMMHKLQCQLINRENDREALKTILKCIEILKEDKASVAAFPEGGIDDDGLLHHFRPGVFKIAMKAKVPIVVCTLKNTKDVVDHIYKWKPSHTEMTVLETIPVEAFQGKTAVDLANYCHDLMARDLGSELVGD